MKTQTMTGYSAWAARRGGGFHVSRAEIVARPRALNEQHNLRGDEMTNAIDNVWCEVEIDEESLSRGWDGDEPLDEGKLWTPYVATLFRGERGDAEFIDSIGDIWVSDDEEGQQYLMDVTDQYLLDDGDDSLPRIGDLDIRVRA